MDQIIKLVVNIINITKYSFSLRTILLFGVISSFLASNFIYSTLTEIKYISNFFSWLQYYESIIFQTSIIYLAFQSFVLFLLALSIKTHHYNLELLNLFNLLTNIYAYYILLVQIFFHLDVWNLSIYYILHFIANASLFIKAFLCLSFFANIVLLLSTIIGYFYSPKSTE